MIMQHVAAWQILSIKMVFKEESFKTSYRVYAHHNYYGVIILLQKKLAVAPDAIYCSYYVQMYDCC
jgi:hypothetical protein